MYKNFFKRRKKLRKKKTLVKNAKQIIFSCLQVTSNLKVTGFLWNYFSFLLESNWRSPVKDGGRKTSGEIAVLCTDFWKSWRTTVPPCGEERFFFSFNIMVVLFPYATVTHTHKLKIKTKLFEAQSKNLVVIVCFSNIFNTLVCLY